MKKIALLLFLGFGLSSLAQSTTYFRQLRYNHVSPFIELVGTHPIDSKTAIKTSHYIFKYDKNDRLSEIINNHYHTEKVHPLASIGISAEYLAKATSGLVKPTQDWMPKDYRYGYFWYQTFIKVGDKKYYTEFAWGGGGQRVIVIEELDLTIVISGHDGEDEIMTQISEIVIPAFVKL